jgi:ribonuclease D
MKTLRKSTPKDFISSLPKEAFEGQIVVVHSETEMTRALLYLNQQKLVGFDTETKPAFQKGVTHKVSLMQISTPDVCFLFRLNHIKNIRPLFTFLESPNTIKIGLSIKDDIAALQKRQAFKPTNFVELQNLVKNLDISDMSLQKIYANLFEKRISKSARLSNWDIDILSDSQKQYAALDAFACLKIYAEVLALLETKNYQIINTETE